MKILQIHAALNCGGIETFVVELSNEMVKRHEIETCSIFELQEECIALQRLNKQIPVHTAHKKSQGMDLKCLWDIYRIITKGCYDVVHTHGCMYYYLLPVILLHRKTKFFYTVHSDAVRENVRWDAKIFRLKRWFFKRKWIQPVVISKESQRSFMNFYGFSAKMIYNGISKPQPKIFPIDQYRLTPHTKILFHPGRITQAKNQRMLCAVFDRLIKEGHDIVLLIAGEAQEMDIYDIIRPYFSKRIQYLGMRNDVTDILNSSDAFCLSSIWEGMPITLLEALSVGCIPVCTPVGGIPEAVQNGVNGFLAKSCEEEDYYLAVKQFLNTNKKTLQVMKAICREKFEQFNIAQTALEYERFFKEAVYPYSHNIL